MITETEDYKQFIEKLTNPKKVEETKALEASPVKEEATEEPAEPVPKAKPESNHLRLNRLKNLCALLPWYKRSWTRSKAETRKVSKGGVSRTNTSRAGCTG